MINFSFKKLAHDHLPVLYKWYNQRHVLRWYSKKPLDYLGFEKKYRPYISGELGIFGFLCCLNKKPIGYIQYYLANRHPPENDIVKLTLAKTAGVDLFIGEKSFLGKGLGRMLLSRFLQKRVFPFFDHCIIDPEVANKKAVKAYAACGFKIIDQMLSERGEAQYLMIKSKKAIL